MNSNNTNKTVYGSDGKPIGEFDNNDVLVANEDWAENHPGNKFFGGRLRTGTALRQVVEEVHGCGGRFLRKGKRKEEGWTIIDNVLQVIVAKPRDCDVLCGKGKGPNNREGNKRYHEIVRQYKPKYKAPEANNATKQEIADQVVREVHENDAARFLQKIPGSDHWIALSDAEAAKKVQQCFRDNNGRNARNGNSENKKINNKKKKKRKRDEGTATVPASVIDGNNTAQTSDVAGDAQALLVSESNHPAGGFAANAIANAEVMQVLPPEENSTHQTTGQNGDDSGNAKRAKQPVVLPLGTHRVEDEESGATQEDSDGSIPDPAPVTADVLYWLDDTDQLHETSNFLAGVDSLAGNAQHQENPPVPVDVMQVHQDYEQDEGNVDSLCPAVGVGVGVGVGNTDHQEHVMHVSEEHSDDTKGSTAEGYQLTRCVVLKDDSKSLSFGKRPADPTQSDDESLRNRLNHPGNSPPFYDDYAQLLR